MPDTIKISELNEALAIADAAEFPYTQENGGELTTFKAPLTQIAAKVVEDMSYAGINLPVGAGVKSVENTLNYLLGAVGGDPNANITDEYDPTAAYVKDDLCIYENVLYICTAPTTGTFDPSKWTATTIDNVIGSLSTLTTTVKSSLVEAVNEVNANLPKQVYKNLNWENVHSFVAELNTLYLLVADSGNNMAIARIFSNGTTNLGIVSGSKITALSYENGRLKITTNNCGLIAVRIA